MSAVVASDERDMEPTDYERSPDRLDDGAADAPVTVDVSDLVGAAEIAENFGFKHPQSIHTLRRRHRTFPAPVATLKRAHIWSWAAVERWARLTGRFY